MLYIEHSEMSWAFFSCWIVITLHCNCRNIELNSWENGNDYIASKKIEREITTIAHSTKFYKKRLLLPTFLNSESVIKVPQSSVNFICQLWGVKTKREISQSSFQLFPISELTSSPYSRNSAYRHKVWNDIPCTKAFHAARNRSP